LIAPSLSVHAAAFTNLFVYILHIYVFFACFVLAAKTKSLYVSYLGDLYVLNKAIPRFGTLLTLTLASLIGLPPFGGFMIKFNLLFSLFQSGNIVYLLAAIIVILFQILIYFQLLSSL